MASTSNIVGGSLSSLRTTFKWKLDGQLFKCTELGVIFSPEFSANNSRWRLELYTKGADPESEDFVSLFLRLLSPSESGISATFIFSVPNTKNKTHILFKSIGNVFTTNSSIGYQMFLKREDILKDPSDYLTSDKELIIKCEIISNANQHTEVLINIESLFNSAKFSDVELHVEGKVLYAHKNILANKSSVFSAMFEHKMIENIENVVKIYDIDHNVVVELLRFIYTGRVNNIQIVAQRLLVAADKYELYDLKTICGDSLCSELSISTSLELLNFANRYRVLLLEQKAMEFIVKNAQVMVDLPGFNSILKLPEDVTMTFIRKLAFKKPFEPPPCILLDVDE